jgi:pimeloyl-ACP methyl ester carboxylesterase/DNA-binding CsgD family transcriptional regulator
VVPAPREAAAVLRAVEARVLRGLGLPWIGVKQEIRFCTAPDGARLAYATHGSGPTLVKAGNWLTHLEYDWESPIWRHWLRDLGATNTMIRYDDRGCGLSQRELTASPTLDTFVGDLEAVIDAAAPDRFALLSISGGGTAAVSYATRHPERLSHLVIYGGYARGRFRRDELQRQQSEALISLMRVGWGQSVPALRRIFTSMWAPGASEEQLRWWDELQRKTITGENAAKLWNTRAQIDVTEIAPKVTTPTLVLHAREDGSVPCAEGRLLASLIPNARLVTLESANHILQEDEPAWAEFLSEVRAFLGAAELPQASALGELSEREHEVLELVAAGLSNEQIAGRLFLSVRTVERHLSNIYAKLRISGKAARAAAAARFSRT